MLIYQLMFHSAHPHHSDYNEAVQHSRIREEGRRWLRRKKRNSRGISQGEGQMNGSTVNKRARLGTFQSEQEENGLPVHHIAITSPKVP